MPYDPERHGPHRVVGPGFHEKVYAVVMRIPRGRVATYGDVAAALGLRAAARQVGFALAALSSDQRDVPWHRVVNRLGQISARGDGSGTSPQQTLLGKEGLRFDDRGRIQDFDRHRFRLDAERQPTPVSSLEELLDDPQD